MDRNASAIYWYNIRVYFSTHRKYSRFLLLRAYPHLRRSLASLAADGASRSAGVESVGAAAAVGDTGERRLLTALGAEREYLSRRRVNLMPRTGVVYAIVNPKTEELCYIGETLDFQTRKVNHLLLLRDGKHTNWKLQRLYKHLFQEGYTDFIWWLLAEVDEEHLNDSEISWTTVRSLGFDLCNISNGGDGRTGPRPPHSAETKAKIGAAHKGRALSEAHKEHLRGKKHTQAWKDAQSIRMQGNTFMAGKPSPRRGKTISEEHRLGLIEAKQRPGAVARGEASGMAKLTENDVREIRRSCARGERHCDIAKRFSVTPENIRCIEIGKTWKHVSVMEN